METDKQVDLEAQENINGARVLIADDDEDFRGMLVRKLKKMGLEVTSVEDGNLAIEKLDDASFDLIIVDLYMPGKTGLDVIQYAQTIDPHTQAIMITGSASLENAVEALRARAFDYLTKPLESLAIFEITVTRALKQRHLENENERLFAEIQRLATTDPLTGLYNRHRLNESMTLEVERAVRYKRELAIIMLDLDGMKKINDTYGHTVGDQALCHVANAIRDEARNSDIPARFGGDEFILLLPETDAEEATNVAKRILMRVTREKVHNFQVPVSIGVTDWQSSFKTAEDMLRAVDQALYHSKRSGGLRISVMGAKDRGQTNGNP